MSTVAEDERSLLEAIREAVGSYHLEARISSRIYPYMSYILTNVTTHKLDGLKMAVPSISDARVAQSTVEEFDFSTTDFEDISFVLKEIERASSVELDAHNCALSLSRILHLPRMPYDHIFTVNFILVGTLAAFAVTHGVWLLVLKFICANSSEEDITMVLKRVEGLFISLRRNQGNGLSDYHPDFYIYISILSSTITRMPIDSWNSMDSLYRLIKAMFEVVSVAHLFLKDVFEFIPQNMKDEFDSLMLLSIYWVTRGVFACSSECDKLPKNGFVIQDSQKLSDICDKLISIHKRLETLENTGKQHMDDEKIANAYQIPNKKGKQIYHALMALFGIQPKESDLVLTHCSGKNADLSEVTLRCKTLVLLISGLDISSNMIFFLKNIYVAFRTSPDQAECEFIWLPIHNDPRTTHSEEQYTKLLDMMSWYGVVHHSNVSTEKTRKFIRDVWKFHRKPIMVVLNENGDVVNPNAVHMAYSWGTKAFPFTRMRERSLWKGETKLDALVLGVDDHMSSMLKDSKWVILYGGMDAEWIKKFITCIRGISVDSGTSIEMIYVGKNAKSEKIQEIISSIFVDTPDQHCSLDSKKIWHFWTRLESLLISRFQAFTASDATSDRIILQLKNILSYASAESWACLFLRYSDLMIHGLGNIMLQGFMEYDLWKQHLHTKDFPKIFQFHIEQLRKQVSDHPCSRMVLNTTDNKDVVQSLTCPHCSHFMEKKIQYRCCHTDEDELE